MAIKFGTQEWIQELCDRLNASETYAQVAATWEGDLIIGVLPDDSWPRPVHYYINLQHDKASEPRLMSGPDERKALFISSAPFSTWKKVMDGRLDPIQAMFSSKIKLIGSMAAVQRNPKATYELTKITGEIDTDFEP